MGGHAVGELASKIAIDTVPHTFHKLKNLATREALQQAIEEANTAIYNRGQQNRDFHNMGTTCTTLVLCPEGAIVGHIGDSRLYRIREGRIDQLTFDHSLQWELLRQGRLAPEEIVLHQPRNIITRCLGPHPDPQVDMEGPYAVLPRDVYLLCSDGLTGLVHDQEIGMIAQTLAPADACRLLVNLANLRGGNDNITVVIARVGDIPAEVSHLPPSEPIPKSNLHDWAWLLGFWGLGSLLVTAVALILLGKPVEGVLTLGLTILAAGGMLLSWLHTSEKRSRDVPEGTVICSPHRTAAIRLNPKFLSQLGALENALQQTASEEGWEINWTEQKQAYEKAKVALAARNYATALQEIGRAIQILMAGIQYQRRRLDHLAKWRSGE
jgi:protein phosphatase